MANPLSKEQKEKLQSYIWPGYMDEYVRLYACPQCGYQIKEETKVPLDHILWSDGVTHEEFPYARFPELWYCPDCDLIDWTSKLIKVDEFCLGTTNKIPDEFFPWKDVARLLEPQLPRYRSELKNRDFGYGITLEDRIRRRMWQKLNNKFRPVTRKKEIAKPITLTNEHREIVNDLHSWMYEDNPEEALLKAEMLRQLGRFELSNQLLQKIHDNGVIRENGEWKYQYRKWWQVIDAHNQQRSSDLALVFCDIINY